MSTDRVMSNYPWVPWFVELAKKISEKGESYLIEKSQQVNWRTDKPKLFQFKNVNIDPFSFFYFLAQNNGRKDRKEIFGSVHEVFGQTTEKLTSDLIIPTPIFIAPVFFHDGKTGNPELLWQLFQSAVENKINPIDFNETLALKGVGVKKLTQTLFLINPHDFLPVDDSTEVTSLHIWKKRAAKLIKEIEKDGYQKYNEILNEVRQNYPGCEPCEINRFQFMQGYDPLVTENSRFFQISSQVYNDGNDYWEQSHKNQGDLRTFANDSCVFTGGPNYPLQSPRCGDIILVRFGRREGRGIGVVEENEYEESGWSKDSQIRVFWINKSSHTLSADTAIHGFSNAPTSSSTYTAFAKSDRYRKSMEFILELMEINSQPDPVPASEQSILEPPKLALNTIIYGPPGTGKTYATKEYCVEICDGVKDRSDDEISKRYRSLVASGHVRFATFHQSYGYEDFVEGLRPKTSSNNGESVVGIQLEPVPGLLKEIAEKARDCQNENFVLVIDEINRANISKVMGELITILEEDKRDGALNQVEVTLPYSKSKFTLPANLYILGTMNTADRSIALLDTALRRRFNFEELPPNPELLRGVLDSEDIDLSNVLISMNRRLEWLIDRDHLIGHAWFMGVKTKDDVDNVMGNKIIPLIAEYFYDDWNKVRSVLGGGDGFVKRESLNTPPGFDDTGEKRYKWSIRKKFSTEAYTQIYDDKQQTAAKENQ